MGGGTALPKDNANPDQPKVPGDSSHPPELPSIPNDDKPALPVEKPSRWSRWFGKFKELIRRVLPRKGKKT